MKTKSILIVENLEKDLRSSRMPLGDFLKSHGYTIEYTCPSNNSDGIHHLPILRNKLTINLLRKGLKKILLLEKQYDIDIILSFRLVPNILNFLSSYIRRKKTRILVITGLGVVFTQSNQSLKNKIIRRIIKRFYSLASKRLILISQNQDDLKDLGINGHIINGSGVSPLNSNCKVDSKELNLLYAGRLLKTKGIIETFNIFQKLKEIQPNTKLTIAGEIDLQNPDSISYNELEVIKNTRGVKFLGYVDDLNPVYSSCNVLLFLSTYREGVPRVIIEALKFGLTVITYNLPGCKNTINENGLLIEPYSENEANSVIQYLASLNIDSLRVNSINSYSLFENHFSLEKIYPEYLKHVSKTITT